MVLLYHCLLFRKEDEEENKEEAGEDKGYALGALLPLDRSKSVQPTTTAGSNSPLGHNDTPEVETGIALSPHFYSSD